MTVQKSFKQRVRARMARTGERYAAARRHLVAARPDKDEVADLTAAAPAPGDPTAPSSAPPLDGPASLAAAGATSAEVESAGAPADGAAAEPAAAPTVDLGMSSEALRRRTGRGWEEWLPLLDAWGAVERSHPQIATYLRDELGIDGWWAQGITVGYERARGMRAVGQR